MRYSKDHLWVRKEGDLAYIGISIFHVEELGDITFIDFPALGKEVEKDGVLCYIESIKAASDVYSPVSCKVVEINQHLKDAPEWVNKDAEGEGWIMKVSLTNPSEFDKLMDHTQYESYLTQD
ncbi:glycine cleavage system protein GcvH [Spirochaeta cellobiosiphila]|uniref:glycine cleavage system protein GcvH n=1 Tax=Spirochaeta cellobiosiphila TaxID=504483 RepID=UPI0004116331|nr:glycine cleavage system protein GcvH [Spirochaeta cellobiosiphila]